jgi:hypothetical protein
MNAAFSFSVTFSAKHFNTFNARFSKAFIPKVFYNTTTIIETVKIPQMDMNTINILPIMVRGE